MSAIKRARWWLQLAHHMSPPDPCVDGGEHDWEEFAGYGAVGFEYGWECLRCGKVAR